MRVIRQCAIIVGLTLGLSGQILYSQGHESSNKPERLPDVGFIRNTGEFDGAGCSLWLLGDRTNSRDRYILLADSGERAVMNIGGRDTALKLVRSTGGNSELKKGDRLTYRYHGEAVDVVVRYVVTGVCAPDDESCEVTNYDATVTVQTRSGKRTVRAHGICGS